MQKHPHIIEESANYLWPAVGGAGTALPTPPEFSQDAALLTALAASGARLARAANLAEWRAILAAEVESYLPGADCTIYLAPEWSPFQQTPDNPALMVPLLVDDQRVGRLIVCLPAGQGGAGAAALLDVLARFAAMRLAHLPARTTSALETAERERRLLERLQGPAQLLATRLDPQSLFDEVVRLAAELTEGETATLLLDEPQGRGLILQAEWGHPDGARPRCYLGRWGVAGQVITSGAILLIDHAPTDPRYAAPAFGRPGKSLIGVPLRRGGRVIGALNVSNHSRYFAFTETHVDLLGMLAHYATIGIEVADLLTEREERNADLQQLNGTLTTLYEDVLRTAREQSALYAISRRIQSTPDIEAALPDVLAVLAKLVEAESGGIYLSLNPGPQAVARPPSLVAYWGTPQALDAENPGISLPLHRGGLNLGKIVLTCAKAQDGFAQNDLDLVGAVADQLALALENRSLLVRDLAALQEAPHLGRARLDLPGLLIHLLTQTQTIGALKGAAALLYDAATDDWQTVAEVGHLPSYWPLPLGQQRAALDQLRRSGELVRFSPARAGGAQLLLMPLLVNNRPLGAFVLPVPANHSLDAKLPFLNALAGRAAIMVHNVQLQLQAEELLILEERNRIAQSMHDGLAQNLTQIRIRCELIDRIMTSDAARAARELKEVRADLKNSAAELVRVINALALPPLGEEGLGAALQKLGEAFTRPGRLRVEVTVPTLPLDLPPQVELTLFRVAQESLRNAIWHLGADYCQIVLGTELDNIVLAVEDNGSVTGLGSRGGTLAWPDLHPNLGVMQNRVTEFGGTLSVVNTPGIGTQLVVLLPRSAPRAIAVRAGEER
jgi:signal transduction histidine kinase